MGYWDWEVERRGYQIMRRHVCGVCIIGLILRESEVCSLDDDRWREKLKVETVKLHVENCCCTA